VCNPPLTPPVPLTTAYSVRPFWHNRLSSSSAKDIICWQQFQGDGLPNRSLEKNSAVGSLFTKQLNGYNSRENITTRNQKWERTAIKSRLTAIFQCRTNVWARTDVTHRAELNI
jgi:hypothetical protein